MMHLLEHPGREEDTESNPLTSLGVFQNHTSTAASMSISSVISVASPFVLDV